MTQLLMAPLLQVRVQTLNDDLKDKFCQWYPGMTNEGTLVDGHINAQRVSC